jgi:hypothetical protein
VFSGDMNKWLKLLHNRTSILLRQSKLTDATTVTYLKYAQLQSLNNFVDADVLIPDTHPVMM